MGFYSLIALRVSDLNAIAQCSVFGKKVDDLVSHADHMIYSRHRRHIKTPKVFGRYGLSLSEVNEHYKQDQSPYELFTTGPIDTVSSSLLLTRDGHLTNATRDETVIDDLTLLSRQFDLHCSTDFFNSKDLSPLNTCERTAMEGWSESAFQNSVVLLSLNHDHMSMLIRSAKMDQQGLDLQSAVRQIWEACRNIDALNRSRADNTHHLTRIQLPTDLRCLTFAGFVPRHLTMPLYFQRGGSVSLIHPYFHSVQQRPLHEVKKRTDVFQTAQRDVHDILYSHGFKPRKIDAERTTPPDVVDLLL